MGVTRPLAARGAWRWCAGAIALSAALASCSPAPGVATRTPPPAAAGGVGGLAPGTPPRAPSTILHDANAARIAADRADSLLGMWMPAMSPPRVDSLGRLDWSPRAHWSAEAAHARVVLRDAADSLAGWRTLAAEPASVLKPYALRRVASVMLAHGDTLGADGALAELATLGSVWSWEAVRTRCDVAIAGGEPARAESLLERASERGWSPLDLSALRMRQARLAQERGDWEGASARAREVLLRFPSQPPAAGAIALLQRFATMRAMPVPLADARQAAESARLRGDRASSIEWLERAHALAAGATRARVAIQWSRSLREARRFDAALAVITSALHEKPAALLAAELRLERARGLRDAGRSSEALRAFTSLEHDSLTQDLAAAAGWEHGLELVAAGRVTAAQAALRYAANSDGDRSEDARLLCGVLWIAEGKPQLATTEWSPDRAEGEAFTFWRAIIERTSTSGGMRDVADRALAMIAARPGYSFYRVAARESLGVHGWPDSLSALASCRAPGPEVRMAEALGVMGDRDAAMLALQRLRSDVLESLKSNAAVDSACVIGSLVDAARLAIGMNAIPFAIRLAQNALEASVRPKSRADEWTLNALRFPPALDTLYGAIPESLTADPLDRALLRAVTWQESRFDPRARSKSDALGLYQLKLATAGDMARRLGDGAPDRETLFDPAMSLRYGREYLKWLLERFGNQWPVAVSAYNSGPSPVSPRWQALLDRGGAALFCELIGRAETRDYVRSIMGARRAYHELRPYASPDSAAGRP